MLVYLDINNIQLAYEKEDLEQVIIDVSSGKIVNQKLSEWLATHRRK